MNRSIFSIALFFLPAYQLWAAPKVLPVLNHPVADRQIAPGVGSQVIDLNSVFGAEAIDDQVVRFVSNFTDSGQPVVLDMALFSNRTPTTRTNFLKYVSDGDYVRSFIHRSIEGFVIQGGGFGFNASNQIVEVAVDAPIPNEFSISNSLGTVSMAKLGGDPNSATSQWFISTGENSDTLDPQNGGFTVFGRVTRASFDNALIFNDPATFPIRNRGGALSDTPLFYTYNGTGTPSVGDFIFFPTVGLIPIPAGQAGEVTTLSYSIVSNSNPAVAAITLNGTGGLQISVPSGAAGASTIVVRATDSVGNTVEDSFLVTAGPETFAAWRARAFNGPERANEAVSGPNADPDGDGLTNLELFVHGLLPGFQQNPVKFEPQLIGALGQPKFLFPLRNDIAGTGYLIEQSGDLGIADAWKTIPLSEVSRTTTGALDQLVIQSATTVSTTRNFFRIRFTQQ